VLCNFGLKSCLWFQIELALHARSILKSRVWFQTKLHSTQFNFHYKYDLISGRCLLLKYKLKILGIRQQPKEGGGGNWPRVGYTQTPSILGPCLGIMTKYTLSCFIECVVLKNIHTPPPMEGICPMTPHRSGDSCLAFYTALNFWVFETPPSLEFPIPSVGGEWIFYGTTQF